MERAVLNKIESQMFQTLKIIASGRSRHPKYLVHI